MWSTNKCKQTSDLQHCQPAIFACKAMSGQFIMFDYTHINDSDIPNLNDLQSVKLGHIMFGAR